jgi:hypothetical protein
MSDGMLLAFKQKTLQKEMNECMTTNGVRLEKESKKLAILYFT